VVARDHDPAAGQRRHDGAHDDQRSHGGEGGRATFASGEEGVGSPFDV
jgi:hypothetical protein